MTSLININNIDITYPVAGQDNDTQGFRTNFQNIRNNFVTASREISSLQSTISSVPIITNPPANPTSPGTPGQVAYDSTHFYVCTATNNWLSFTTSNIELALLTYFGGTVTAGNIITNTVTADNVLATGFFYANGAPFTSSSYGNTDVGGYLASGSDLTITTINLDISELNSNVSVVNSEISALQSNTAGLSNQITGANAVVQTLTNAVGAYETWANAAIVSLSSGANANIAGYLNTTNVTIASAVINSNLVVGNLTVRGTTNTVNSTTSNIGNLIITLAGNASSSVQANGAGIALGGTSANILYYSLSDSWTFNRQIITTGNVTGANLATGGIVSAATVSSSTINSVTVNASTVNASTVNGTLVGFATSAGVVTGLTSANVVSALGYTPYNSTNPNSYISSVPNASTQVSSLGVGIAASGTTGEIRATGDITGFYSSDAQFKENINPIIGAAEIVSEIGGKTFDWTDEYIATHGGEDGYFVQKHDFGMIAQDVQRWFPMAVRTRPDGSLAVDYPKLTALAFAAIAELKAEITALNGKLK